MRLKGEWSRQLRVADLDDFQPRILIDDQEVLSLRPFAWSPDGNRILAVFGRKDGNNQIVLVSSTDGSVRALKSLEWRYPRRMSFSPDGRFIAYDVPVKQDSSNHDIFLLSTDGSRETAIVEHPADDGLPVWTPDGTSILFISDRTATPSYWLIPLSEGKPAGSAILVKSDIGQVRPVGFTKEGAYYYSHQTAMIDVYLAELEPTTGRPLKELQLASRGVRGRNTVPRWSPDGRHLAYISFRDAFSPAGEGTRFLGPGAIIIQSIESGEERELAAELEFAQDTRVRWSPDGRFLLVSGRDKERRLGLHRIDVQTGAVSPIVVTDRTPPRSTAQAPERWHAVWSRDGKAIFYLRDEDGLGCEIRIREMEGGADKVFYRPDSPTHLLEPALSPDGRWLAFGTSRQGHIYAQAILIMPASGGTPRELLRLDEETQIRAYSIEWAGDGKHLLFSKRVSQPFVPSKLWRVPIEGGKAEDLGLPVWGRGGLSVHPDGRRLAYSYRTSKTELWVMENFLPAVRAAK